MKILHYGLGFPPYRTGGLTKYCIDLMLTQKEMGHDVAMMWPGKFTFSGHFVRIKKNVSSNEITGFQVINPLPVPLDEGIKDIDEYMRKCPNPQVYTEFLKEYLPDVIHVHTLMGLHRELLEEAKKIGIKIVFTTHDYFGICPKVTLFRNGQVCDGNCEYCTSCNESALSLKKIMILQSGMYRTLKNTKIVKKLRKAHRQEFFQQANAEEQILEEKVSDRTDAGEYQRLRNFYMSFFALIDEVHFNSSVTESVYRKFLPGNIQGKVVNITHREIADHRRIKRFDSEMLRITYLAPAKPFKGYGILRDALDELWDQGERRFRLSMYNESGDNRQYMDVKGFFSYQQLNGIFDDTDVLIMPSICKETFGFTVLEAISYGVPVIVSENVGAKDLVGKGNYGMVIKPTKEGVKEAVKKLIEDRASLEKYNWSIVNEMELNKIINSSLEIQKLYEDI